MILIVDFGSQTAHLIGRRLRKMGITSVYTSPQEVLSNVEKHRPKGIILSGGPASVYEKGSPTLPPTLFSLGLPMLGICYGWQLMAHLLGGEVKSGKKEYGPEEISFSSNVFVLPRSRFTVIMSHGDHVAHVPEGFEVIASTKSNPCAAVLDKKRALYGVQFHPEVDHTEQGVSLLEHFAKQACGCPLLPFLLDPEKMIEEIRSKVGEKEVVCGVSGGVDSTVAAFLIAKAIDKRLHPIYIDSGLMRQGTKERVQHLFANVVIVEAKQRFLDVLKGLEDPEEKRKAIGKLYVDLFQEEASKRENVSFLAQGTIYSDVIESKGSTHASNIKSHHNVGGLPKELKLTLLEPLRHYYKDEVREIGTLLGIDEKILKEHPFPGPGYAIRIRGKVDEKRLSQVRQADNIVIEEIERAGLYDHLFQCFALMSGAFSTAIKGDARAFSEVVALRAYESTDVMTLQWAHLPYELLQRLSSRIVNEVPDISRVVYDITTKPPATMEWE